MSHLSTPPQYKEGELTSVSFIHSPVYNLSREGIFSIRVVGVGAGVEAEAGSGAGLVLSVGWGWGFHSISPHLIPRHFTPLDSTPLSLSLSLSFKTAYSLSEWLELALGLWVEARGEWRLSWDGVLGVGLGVELSVG